MSKKDQKTEDPKPEAAADANFDVVPEETESAENAAGNSAPPAGESELDKLKAEVAAAQDKLLYLQADYQNYRKRMVKELADARMLGISSTIEPFLQVFDFLSMAKIAAEKSDNIEAIRQGIAMIIGEYTKAFDELGVTRPQSVGKTFDPNWQEAMAQEASDTVPEGTVIKEWSSAYKLGERILRPAKVVVSKGPAVVEDAAPEA